MVAASGKVGKGVPQRLGSEMTYGCEELVQLNSARSVLLHGLLEDPLILSPVLRQLSVPTKSVAFEVREGAEFAPRIVRNSCGSSYGLRRTR
jgi:hypothetical protein